MRALITGATGGLGRAFAWEFASRGWDVLLTDLNPDALKLLVEGVTRAHGVSARGVDCNLACDEDRARLIEDLRHDREQIGAVVNVAGFDVEGAFLDQGVDDLVRLLRVNMEAGLVLTHSVSGGRAGSQPLRIINTASLAAFYPMPFKATYAASKSFIVSTSLALREELRGRATVTVLCPAGMPTTPSARDAIDAQGLMGRLTTMNPSDVARITVDAALRGSAIVVPGLVNQALRAASGLIPRRLLASIIGRRWGAARGYTAATSDRQRHASRRVS